jgi:hypothetical protein
MPKNFKHDTNLCKINMSFRITNVLEKQNSSEKKKILSKIETLQMPQL